jgi:flagellar biosynthesis chaperone FliJ
MSEAELTQTQATAQELAEAIADLEQYRERLVTDTLAMAQRAKVMRTTALANLEPELGKIDVTIQALRDQQTALTAAN